jgi:hypothetical protein
MDYIPLHQLAGTWYIQLTNFPMWTKGNRTQPAFKYGLGNKNGHPGLTDEVSYQKNGRKKFIRGFNTSNHEKNTAFIWRGKGILSLLSSNWKILYFSEEEGWALIFFERTRFTPEGFDVITRQANPANATMHLIQQKLIEMELNTPLVRLPPHPGV